MKKSILARGFIGSVASLLGVMAVGCGADVGPEGAAGDSADIGAVSQPLSAVLGAPNNPTDLANAQRMGFSSACSLTVNNVDYIIRAGGFDSTGAASNLIVVLQKGQAPLTQAATLSQPNGAGQMVKVSATECLYVGGATVDNAGTARANVDLLSLGFSGSTPVVTKTAKTALNTPRSNFILRTCTDNSGGVHAVALGGKNGSTTFLDTIEISNTAFSSWAQNTALAVPRADFGADIDPTNRNILAGGGKTTLGSRVASLDMIKLSTACAFTSTTPEATESLPHAIDGLVIHHDGATGDFVSSAGTFLNPGATLETTVKTYDVDFSGTPFVNSTGTASTSFVGTYRPYFVRKDADEIYLVGGSNAAINASIATVQEFSGGSWDPETANAAMYGATGEYMPNAAEVWAISGYSTAPATVGTVVDAFTD